MTMENPRTVEAQRLANKKTGVPWVYLILVWFFVAVMGAMVLPARGQDPGQSNTGDDAAPPTAQPTPSGEFVAVPDLAAQLKKIDPNAVVEWDGRRLRITAKNQKFSLFLSTSDVVVNGTPQKVSSPLRVYRGELYVPQDAVDLLAGELAKTAAEPTPALTPTPVPTPTPTPTPAATQTPAPTPSPTPTPTPQPTLSPSPVVSPTVTPPSPQQVLASPTPRSTSSVTVEVKPPTRATPTPPRVSPKPSGDVFARLLHEREQISQLALAPIPRAELEKRARDLRIGKIILDPDEGITADASSEVRRQSHLTLQLAMKIKTRLTLAGYKVELTREDPQYVTLAQKLERIRASQGDLLVSLRAGANSSASVSGARVLYPSPTTEYAVGKAELASSSDTVPIEQTYLPFAEKSKQLAALCLTALKMVSTSEAPTMLPAPVFLGRRAPMPSVHLIVGYLTNPSDRTRLLDEAEQDRLAEALSQAIVQFATGAKSNREEQPATEKGEQP